MPDVAAYPYDFPPRWTTRLPASSAWLELLAQHFLAGEELLRECLVHDHYLQRLHVVPLGKVAPLEQRNLHRVEILQSYGAEIRTGQLAFRKRMLKILEGNYGALVRHRQHHDAAGRLHSR